MAYLGNTPTTQAFSPAVDVFSGNGSTTAFTLSRPVASVAQVEAVIENVVQSPVDAFTVSGNTITFTSAPPSGSSNIYVKYTSPITQVITPSYGTVGQNQMTQGAPYWDVNGNVGIGTSSPAQKLDVSGAAGFGWAFTSDQAVTRPSGSISLSGTNIANQQTYSSIGGSTTVGQIYNYASVADSYYRFLDIVAFGSTTGAGSNIRFITGNGTTNSERARIDPSGNLLVGTTSTPTGAANGAALMNTGYLITSRASTSSSTQAAFYNPNGLVGSISTSGSTTSFNTSSDYRLKENIAPMTGALSVVQQLKPCTYTWKADGSDGQGFIAHELQAVVPDAVTGEKDAVDADGNPVYQGIDTSFLVATLTAAIQEQQALITSLTSRIAALEAK